MPPPQNSEESGGRLTGEDLRLYMESFADRFLKGVIRYDTIVTNIRREHIDDDCAGIPSKPWVVTVRDRNNGHESTLRYDRIVLCTGVRTSLLRMPIQIDLCL